MCIQRRASVKEASKQKVEARMGVVRERERGEPEQRMLARLAPGGLRWHIRSSRSSPPSTKVAEEEEPCPLAVEI